MFVNQIGSNFNCDCLGFYLCKSVSIFHPIEAPFPLNISIICSRTNVGRVAISDFSLAVVPSLQYIYDVVTSFSLPTRLQNIITNPLHLGLKTTLLYYYINCPSVLK